MNTTPTHPPASGQKRVRDVIAHQTTNGLEQVPSVEPSPAPVAYLLTRPSGFSWAAVPREMSPVVREMLVADKVKIKPLHAGTAPVAQAAQDAARFAYLTADLAGSDREHRNALLSRMAVMSYSAACADIDAAMKGTK